MGERRGFIALAPGMGQDGASREPRPKAPVAASDIVAAPSIVQTDAPGEPKPSGTAAAEAFLRGALAQGPLDVKEIERRAVDAGLLEEKLPISKSKVFRSARAMLGVKTAMSTNWIAAAGTNTPATASLS